MTHKKLKHMLPLVAALLPLVAGAQSAVVATGGRAESATHSVSYSVGQTAVASANTVAYRLNEGVQQPLTVEEVGIGDTPTPDLHSPLIYPNPTAMSITLRREGDAEPAEVRLYSLDGRMLHAEQWDGATLTLDLNAYAAGVYMLKVNDRTYKITKQ